MCKQSLKLLRATVWEEMRLQEKNINWALTLTFVSMSYQMLPSTHYIMRHMHLRSLKLLHAKVLEEVYLQENALFVL